MVGEGRNKAVGVLNRLIKKIKNTRDKHFYVSIDGVNAYGQDIVIRIRITPKR